MRLDSLRLVLFLLCLAFCAAAFAQTCPSGASRPWTQPPVNGNPIAIAASGSTVFEAEYFNCGAEGAAYHDTNAGINAGQTFRADNDVEFIDVLVNGSPSGNLASNHFDTNEWLEWTISIGTTGAYTLGLKASNSPSSGHSGTARILVDGIPAGSDITVTQGADWEDYRWFDTSTSVSLSAGTHVVRLLSVLQSFRIDQMRVTGISSACPTGASRPWNQAPINGQPIPIAASGSTAFEAEHFNCGAEGAAYHDTNPGVNAGQTFRADNDVEIVDVLVNGAPSGNLAANHFDNNEWLEWTISIPATNSYTLGVKASNSPSSGHSGTARILVDGNAVGSDITVTQGADWEDYRWFDTTSVQLSAGTHVVRLLSVLQSFRIDQMRVTAGATPGDNCSRSGLSMCARFEAAEFHVTGQGCAAQPVCSNYACAPLTIDGIVGHPFTWEAQNYGCNSPSPSPSGGNGDRSDDTTRIALTSEAGSRDDGSTAIKFTTQLRDDCVHTSECGQSTDWERSEISLDVGQTNAQPNTEQWYALSVYFPDAFVLTPGDYNASLFMQFHGEDHAANLMMNVFNEPGGRVIIKAQNTTQGGNDGDQYWYRTPSGAYVRGVCVDVLTRNVWYDFVHRIVWSDTNSGVHEVWMRKGNNPPVKVLSATGINTLFTADTTYLKVGTYHFPQYGGTSSVIIDRLRQGNSFEAVANFTKPSDTVQNCNP